MVVKIETGRKIVTFRETSCFLYACCKNGQNANKTFCNASHVVKMVLILFLYCNYVIMFAFYNIFSLIITFSSLGKTKGKGLGKKRHH